jgi:Ca-activated chloride channel homolog
MKYLTLMVTCFIGQVVCSQDKETHKGNLLYLQSQYQSAEEQYRAALKKDSNHTIAKFNLANTLHKQKKYDQAIIVNGDLAASTKDKKIKAASWYNQGVSHTKMKNLEASIESYKNALRIDPNDKEARENLQKALLELKKQKQQQKQKPKSKMSQKEAEQKLKLLQQKEKQIQQRIQNKNKQSGSSQGRDW